MDKAVVVVTHDHRVREIATRIVWLEDGTFRADVITARDPVCSRVIEIEGAPHFEYEVRLYYFCSNDCQKLFEKEPVRYAGT
jgi:putative ABC transport system ATP-binding protein